MHSCEEKNIKCVATFNKGYENMVLWDLSMTLHFLGKLQKLIYLASGARQGIGAAKEDSSLLEAYLVMHFVAFFFYNFIPNGLHL